MAGSGEDAGPRESRPKTDNLFVRFRQFTDEQVSSLLQGVIGLPSAMSRNSSGNPRWADFDEDLRRRDELQARQKELRESERLAYRSKLPVATSGRAPIPTFEEALRAIPLYSPFTPLGRTPGVESSPDLARIRAGSNPSPLTSYDFFYHPGSGLHEVLGFPGKRGQRGTTLFPFLFYSPYSPLALSTISQPAGLPKDHFPYCHAFEDLLLASENLPMVPASKRRYLYEPFKSEQDVMPWLNNLEESGLLTKFHHIQSDVTRSTSATPTAKWHADSAITEQDMYSRFLQRATSSSDSEIPPDPLSMLCSIADEMDKKVKAQFPDFAKALEMAFEEASSQENGGRTRDFLSIIEELAAGETERSRALRSFSEELFGNPTHTQSQQENPQAMKAAEIPLQPLRKPENNTKKDLPDSERVVSSSTTSDHTTHEDGTIERSVTVWMRFADGRETVTTKSHIEDPKRDADEIQEAQSSVQEADQVPKRKGWFWNQ